MNDINLSSIASSLETIASEIGTLRHIDDGIDKLGDYLNDLNQSIDYLSDKIGELKNE